MKSVRIFSIIFIVHCATWSHAQQDVLNEIRMIQDDSLKVKKILSYIPKIIRKDPLLADSLSDVAISISENKKFDFFLGKAFQMKGIGYQLREDFDASHIWLKKARTIYQKIDSLPMVQRVNFNMGVNYYRIAEYHLSDSLFSSVLQYATAAQDADLESQVLKSFSASKRLRSKNDEALKYALQSAKLRERNGDSLGLIMDYQGIANILLELNRPEDAIAYFNSGLALNRQTGKTFNEEAFFPGIGEAWLKLKKYNNAKEAYEKSIQVAGPAGTIHLTAVYSGLARVYYNTGHADSAFSYMHKSLQAAFQAHNFNAVASAYGNLSQWYFESSEYKLSNACLDSSYYYAKKSGDRKMLAFVPEMRARLRSVAQQPEEAFSELQKSVALKDSIYNVETARQLNELLTVYETEKKDNEINRLNAEKLLDEERIARQRTVNFSLIAIAVLIVVFAAIIFFSIQKKRAVEKQIAVLERQNAIENMRSKIAIDVHDEIGASLTRLGLNAQQLLAGAGMNDREKNLAEKIALQSKEVITGMREIIWASNPANDNLKSMLGFMRQYIDRFFDGTDIRPVVKFPHDAGEITLHPEVRRNLFLILKESLNNAVKYSGSDRVDIDFSNEN